MLPNALNAEINSPDTPEKLRGVLGKFRSYGARFALTLRLLREACGTKVRGGISAADVAGAVKLCDYFQAHARAVLCRLEQDPEDRSCEALVRWLDRRPEKECAARDVTRAGVAGIKSASQAERLFRAAADRGFGRVEVGTGNRRAVRFILDDEADAGTAG